MTKYEALNRLVKVITSPKYGNKLNGRSGVIENTSCGKTCIGVRIEGLENPKSSIGLFWLNYDELDFIETKEEKEVMLNQCENFKVAGVKFLEGTNKEKEYYYALFDDFSANDLVVVQTGHHGLAIAKIATIYNDGEHRVECSREIVDKVDMRAFEKRCDNRKARARLKEKMDERIAKLQEMALYELLAKDDTELAKMLNDYKDLQET